MNIRLVSLCVAMAIVASAPAIASAQELPWPLNVILPGWASGDWQNGANLPRGGVIASTQRSAFTLEGGTTVFMHKGTVINPTGIRLQPGMRVKILGTPSGAYRFNANEIDVVPR
ncbi:MAG: hypothetical protein JO349_01855 [Candidatus Eremiobacteraeota bacterium]|nr:hypothetical protein [Candidatus Eremiobacteraeota bacterium]